MTFQEENDKLLQNIVDAFYNYFQSGKMETERDINSIPMLELNITSACNQACEYCYLVKHGNELYPKEIRDEETILKNLDIYLNYCLENGFSFNRVDLFSGEIWGMSFGNKVLSTILSYMRKGLYIGFIMIPSNCSFVLNDKAVEQIEYFIEQYDFCGCRLCISCSNDGYVIDKQSRPFRGNGNTDKYKTDEYYEKLFKFCKKHNYGFHPMISAHSIDKWPENYEWWVKKLDEYGFDPPLYSMMLLEVRNDEWTDEAITGYIKYLHRVLTMDLNTIWKGYEDILYKTVFARHKEKFETYLEKVPEDHPLKKLDNSSTWFPYGFGYNSRSMGCTVDRALSIRLGDLALIPCHRTCYEKFVYGKLKVENNKIVGLHAQNPLLANKIYNSSFKTNFVCDRCFMNERCTKGCYGAQYEANKELFYPAKTVCKLYKVKFLFTYLAGKWLFKHYDVGTDDSTFGIEDDIFRELIKDKEYKKWIMLIDSILG